MGNHMTLLSAKDAALMISRLSPLIIVIEVFGLWAEYLTYTHHDFEPDAKKQQVYEH